MKETIIERERDYKIYSYLNIETMKVEATIINPAYKKAVDQLEYDLKHYLYIDPWETRRDEWRKLCEMM